jgi:hypothetical protein
MKTGRILCTMMLGIVVVFAVSTGHAQNVRVNIPFNFSIGAQKFTAGEYTLKPLLQHTTLLENERGRGLINIETDSVQARQPPSTTKLIFNRYDDSYFLTQIWQQGNEIGQILLKSPVEAETARTFSMAVSTKMNTGPPGEQVTLNIVPSVHNR